MFLNLLRRICFTFSYYLFQTTKTCFLSTVGNEPLTISMVATLANHYNTNMTMNMTFKFFSFFHIYSLLFKDVCTINCSKKE